MKKATEFYYWFQTAGGNLANLDVSNIVTTLNNKVLHICNFKHRAEEIKAKYNYKFVEK